MGSIVEFGNFAVGHEETEYSNGQRRKVWKSSPSVGGFVDAKIYLFNASDKVIKYVNCYFIPINRVNDVVQCTIKGVAEVGCQYVGPLNPENGAQMMWEAVWNNNSIVNASLTHLEIVFMDGSVVDLKGNELTSIYADDSAYFVKHPTEKKMRDFGKNAVKGIANAFSSVKSGEAKDKVKGMFNDLTNGSDEEGGTIGKLKGLFKK